MSRVLLRTPRFDVWETRALDERYTSDYYLQKLDGVSVAVIFEDEVLLIEVSRRGLSGLSLEFPGGCVESMETPLQAAIRECHEEVGFQPQNLSEMGVVFPLPGYVSERVSLFLALEEGSGVDKVHIDREHEGIGGFRLVKLADLADLCLNGKIRSAVDAYFGLLISANIGVKRDIFSKNK